MTEPAREDVLRRLFPSRVPGADDSEGSLSVAGTVLGHFQIQERIGRGGMGAVFRSTDLRLDRVVALKVLSPEQSHDPSSVQRFHNEARAAAKLDHDNIAQVYFIGEDQGLHYIAFEFITGTNVRELLSRTGVVPVPETVSYVIQIAEALRSTAAAGVVHRDIKPSNIIIEPTGRVTLVDLGLARQASQAGEELTVAGTTLGTFDYISPEQAVDPRRVDVRSDIYSLGCTAYHMLTGEPPYPSRSMFQKIVDHHGSAAPDPSQKNPAVPARLSAIIRKMLASDPDERYATPEAVIRDLTGVARYLGVRPVQMTWDARPLERNWLMEHRGWIAASVAVVLLGLAINKLPVATDSPIDIQPSVSQPPAPPSTDSGSSQTASVAAPPSTTKSPAAVPASATPDTPSPPAASGTGLLTGVGAAKGELTGAFAAPGQLTETEPRTPMVVAAAKEPMFWVLVEGTKERSFPTLEAACTAAPDGATIEIRGNGKNPEPQGPVRIERKRLRLRAAPGTRPKLEFRDVANGSTAVSRWITVSRGALEIAECDLVMRVPSTRTADRWAVLSLDRCEAFTLRASTITVQNDERAQPAAMIEIAREAMNSLSMMSETEAASLEAVDISESILRGEADVIASRVVGGVSVSFASSAVAVSGSLYRVDVSQKRSMMSTEEQPTSLVLDHLTAVLDQPLLVVSADRNRPPILNVTMDDSLVVIRRTDRPLIAFSGEEDQELWLSRLQWRGQTNAFQLAGSMLEVASSPGGRPSLVWTFRDWNRIAATSSSESLQTMTPFERSDATTLLRLSETPLTAFQVRSNATGLQDRFGRPIGADVSRLPALDDPQ